MDGILCNNERQRPHHSDPLILTLNSALPEANVLRARKPSINTVSGLVAEEIKRDNRLVAKFIILDYVAFRGG
jgi:hypothetical protein